MLIPVCFYGLAILTLNAIETGKCDIWCLEVGLQIFLNLWNSIQVSRSHILFLAPLVLAHCQMLNHEQRNAVRRGEQSAFTRSSSVANNSLTTRQTAPASPERNIQVESDPEPIMTRVKQRLPKRNAASNAHEFTSESEDFCDGLSDDSVSSDTAAKPVKFEMGETGPLVPQQSAAESRPNLTDRVADAHSGRKASPPDMIIRPEATEQQVENGKNAYEAFVLAFDSENGPKPDVVNEPNAHTKLRRRPATPAPAKRPNSLPVQSAMTSGPKSNIPVARRPRSRCTKVVNIVNVNDSAKTPSKETLNHAGGDRASTPIDIRSTKQSQPLENVNDHFQSRKAGSGSPNRQREPQAKAKGLRLPQFDGTDWPGFIDAFEACVRYYQWPDQVKAIRLRTSLTGPARSALATAQSMLWSYDQLKQQLEQRFDESKKFEQIQNELFTLVRKPGQRLHEFYDEIVHAASNNSLSDRQREKLIYTAFVYGLRSDRRMHHWVARHERSGTINGALNIAEAYEDSDPCPALPTPPRMVTVNARQITKSPVSPKKTAAALVTSPSLGAQMTAGFQRIERQITTQIARLDNRLKLVEVFQNDQKRRYNERQRNWKPNTQADRQPRPQFKPKYCRKPVITTSNATPQRRHGVWRPPHRRHGPFSNE